MNKKHTALTLLLVLALAGGGLISCQKDEVQVMGTTNFDNLGLGTGEALDVSLGFDGNAQDFYIALDDSADDLLIGLGSVVGTTPGLGIDENLAVTTYGDLTFGGTTPVLTIGDAGAEDAALVYDGTAQDFYVALYDTDDDLIIGLGSTIGSTPIMSFDENQIVSIGGNKLDLDADLDTSITVDTDDQVDLEIAGSDEYVFTAAVFDIAEGTLSRIDLDADGDTSLRSSADDQVELEVGAADEFIFTAGIFDIGNGTLGRVDLDADNDTSVRSRADDEVQLEIAGADEYTFTATIFDVNANKIDLDADEDTSITADTDDQIDFEIGGADEYVFTAGIFDIATNTLNRIDLDADNDTSLRSSADDQVELEVGGADEYIFTAGILDIGNGTLGRVDLDADNDTSIRSSADDQIDFELGGSDILVVAAAAVAGTGNALINLTESFNIMDGSDSYYGIDVNLTGANHTGSSNVLTGIDVDLTTVDPQVNEVALDVSDTDWDVAIEAGVVPIISTAQTWMEDFLGDTIADELVLLAGTDPQALTPAIAQAQYGVVQLVSGDVGTGALCSVNCSEVALGLHWSADQVSLVFETRLNIDTATTNASVCAGLTDVLTIEDPAAIAGTSVTITATDALVFCYDTDATTDQWYAIGVDSGVASTGNAITGVAPTADIYQVLRIEVDAGGEDARFYIDGALVGTLTANAVAPAVLLTPFVVADGRTTSEITVNIDYIFVSAQRQ